MCSHVFAGSQGEGFVLIHIPRRYFGRPPSLDRHLSVIRQRVHRRTVHPTQIHTCSAFLMLILHTLFLTINCCVLAQKLGSLMKLHFALTTLKSSEKVVLNGPGHRIRADPPNAASVLPLLKINKIINDVKVSIQSYIMTSFLPWIIIL